MVVLSFLTPFNLGNLKDHSFSSEVWFLDFSKYCTSSILPIILEVLSEQPQSVADYKAGKDRAIKFMVGQVMKKSKGQANPQLVNKLLLEELAKL